MRGKFKGRTLKTQECGTQNRPFVAILPVGKPKKRKESKTEGIGGTAGTDVSVL
jgi:hypothetical protein